MGQEDTDRPGGQGAATPQPGPEQADVEHTERGPAYPGQQEQVDPNRETSPINHPRNPPGYEGENERGVPTPRSN